MTNTEEGLSNSASIVVQMLPAWRMSLAPVVGLRLCPRGLWAVLRNLDGVAVFQREAEGSAGGREDHDGNTQAAEPRKKFVHGRILSSS